jgi:membrane-bound ClpP family serine protease
MAITALDTHQTVKDLTAAGFTDAQAEALTQALRHVQQIDLSDLATKADLAAVRAEMATKADLAILRAELETKMAELKADILRWVFGISVAQAAMIIAILKLFPGGHP